MSASNALTSSLKTAMEDLLRARQEARVRLHLFSLDARQRYEQLEAKVEALTSKADLSQNGHGPSARSVAKLATSIRGFAARHGHAMSVLDEPVSAIMTRSVRACLPSDPLDFAAKLMWEGDCGVVPVLDARGAVIGIVTDRDLCMGAHTRGRPLSNITVEETMCRTVHTCEPTDAIGDVLSIMTKERVRRLPVVITEGKLAGIVGLGDVARHVAATSRAGQRGAQAALADALALIAQPRS